MAIETRWFIENKVLCHNFSGEITAKDLQKMNQVCDAHLTAAASPVHFLIVINKVENLHIKSQELTALYYDRSTRKVGWVVVVNPHTSPEHHKANAVARTLIQMLRLNAHHVHTFEEATHFLNEAARV
ncbi:MAG: hypothetical protein K8I82_21845 [Anaerolineae bacterium]|nr:hypothetical protein [Anaerolineae bacterium]